MAVFGLGYLALGVTGSSGWCSCCSPSRTPAAARTGSCRRTACRPSCRTTARPRVQRRLHAGHPRHRRQPGRLRGAVGGRPARDLLAAGGAVVLVYAGLWWAATRARCAPTPAPSEACRARFVDRARARARARDQRQPRAGLRLRRPRARRCTTTSMVRVAGSGLAVDIAGEGADDVPRDERHLVVKLAARRLRPARRAAAAGSSSLRQPHPARARPRLVVGRDRRRAGRGARAGARRRRAARRRRRAARSPPSSRATPTTSRPACAAASTFAWTRPAGAAGRAARRARRRWRPSPSSRRRGPRPEGARAAPRRRPARRRRR